jgi:hypothetical protein
VLFSIVICGCATIDSENQSERLAALDKIIDQQELRECVVSAKYEDVKEAALSRITNSQYLVSIAVDKAIAENLRDAAASKLTSEDDATKVIRANQVSEKVCHYLIGLVKSEVLSEQILLDGVVSESIALKAVSNIHAEDVAMKVLNVDKIPLSVKLVAIERVKSAEKLVEICVNNGYCDELRDYSLGALSGDVESLCRVFLENESASFAMKSFAKLPSKDVASERIQAGVFSWSKKIFASDPGREDWINQLVSNLLAEDLQWWVVSESAFPDSSKIIAIKKIGSTDKLMKVVLSASYSEAIRVAAVGKIEDDPVTLEKCILSIDDVGVGLAIAKILPKDRLGTEVIQAQIAKWFGSVTDAKTMAEVLSYLNVDFDLDFPQYQDNLVKMIANADTKENRALARNYLVNPKIIKDLAMQKNGESEDVALWAVDMMASDLWLSKLIGECQNPMVRGRAVSRLSNESQIADVAEHDADTAVRVIAVKHLSSQSSSLLQTLVLDKDLVVGKYALMKLSEYDPLAADGLKKELEKKEAARKAEEAEMRKKEEMADWEQAKRDVERQVYAKAVERQIWDCQECAKVYQTYDCAPNCVLELNGPLVDFEHNWIFADEVILYIEANGQKMNVRCKLKNDVPGNLNKGEKVVVSGKFLRGDQSEIVLEDTVLK